MIRRQLKKQLAFSPRLTCTRKYSSADPDSRSAPSQTSRFYLPSTPPELLYKPIKLPPLPKSRIVFEEESDTRPQWIRWLSAKLEPVVKFYYSAVKKNPFAFYGAPFLATIVVAAYYLQEFTEIRYKAYDESHKVTEADLAGVTATRRTKLKNESKEDYYERNYKLLESAASTDYDIKRVQRRPEDPPVKW
ncbi:hypothetical protein V1512DRAFT_260568 [Lipomyces arxii]|uniref:uncharacterized protein n=1 Tax=Lipomyces arxii TaxID=56418 RepID=UPI0034CDFD02